MPGLPDCQHCPFKDDPEVTCDVVKSGRKRFCKLVDPTSPDYTPSAADELVRLAGRPPSLLKQVANVTRAVMNHAQTGFRQVSGEQQRERLGICNQCVEFFDPVRVRCRHPECGCFLRIKTSWAGESCPINKWSAVTTSTGGCGCGQALEAVKDAGIAGDDEAEQALGGDDSAAAGADASPGTRDVGGAG